MSSFTPLQQGWYFNLGDKGHPALKTSTCAGHRAGLDRFTLNQEPLLDLTQPPTGFWDAFPAYTIRRSRCIRSTRWNARLLTRRADGSNGDGTRDKDGVGGPRYFTTTRDSAGHAGRCPAATGGSRHRTDL
jgi:hypothetical protein